MTSAIDAIVANSAVPVPSTSSSTTTAKQTMNSEMFLKLLVAQLRAQDPSSPMDTNAMTSQTAQLASMEQLTALSKTNQDSLALQMRIAADGLLGKTVGYVDANGKQQTGVATAVSFATSVPTVTVGNSTIRLDAVSGVTSASAA